MKAVIPMVGTLWTLGMLIDKSLSACISVFPARSQLLCTKTPCSSSTALLLLLAQSKPSAIRNMATASRWSNALLKKDIAIELYNWARFRGYNENEESNMAKMKNQRIHHYYIIAPNTFVELCRYCHRWRRVSTKPNLRLAFRFYVFEISYYESGFCTYLGVIILMIKMADTIRRCEIVPVDFSNPSCSISRL